MREKNVIGFAYKFIIVKIYILSTQKIAEIFCSEPDLIELIVDFIRTMTFLLV